MSKRYITKPRGIWVDELEEECPDLPNLTVYEPEAGPQPTGLLDANGNDLYCVSERQPIGFRGK